MADAIEVHRLLKEAIGSGKVFSISYQGGSQPGAHRRIEPLAMLGPDKVRTRCHTSSATKVFSVDKIALLAPGENRDATESWDTGRDTPRPPPAVRNINANHSLPIAVLTARHRADLEAIGWTVILLSDEQGGSLCLHAIRKGEVEKLPTVMLAYHPIRYDLAFSIPDGFERANVRRLPKPWRVTTRWDGKGGMWKDEAPAVEAFLREASTYP